MTDLEIMQIAMRKSNENIKFCAVGGGLTQRDIEAYLQGADSGIAHVLQLLKEKKILKPSTIRENGVELIRYSI